MSNTGVKGFEPARLQAARERAGLTQRDLAEKLVTATQINQAATGTLSLGQLRQLSRKIESIRTQINYYEAAKRTPRPDMLYHLATALGVDPLDLLDPRTPVTLATLRAQRGLLQEDVARHLNCSRSYYARMEAGTAGLKANDRERLAALFGTSVSRVLEAVSAATTDRAASP